jgi:hypothetical protein
MSLDVVLDPPACERRLDQIQSNARFAVVGPETGQAAVARRLLRLRAWFVLSRYRRAQSGASRG